MQHRKNCAIGCPRHVFVATGCAQTTRSTAIPQGQSSTHHPTPTLCPLGAYALGVFSDPTEISDQYLRTKCARVRPTCLTSLTTRLTLPPRRTVCCSLLTTHCPRSSASPCPEVCCCGNPRAKPPERDLPRLVAARFHIRQSPGVAALHAALLAPAPTAR